MRLFRHPRWQHLDYRLKVATTQENKPPTQGTRQWTFTTPRWRCGSILLLSLNAGVPEPTGGCPISNKPNIHDWAMKGHQCNSLLLQEEINVCQTDSFQYLCWQFEIWWMTSKTLEHLSYTTSSFVHHFIWPLVDSNWSYSLETLNLGKNHRFFVPCDLETRRMILKNNRAPLLCYFKLCSSFHSHQ